MTAFFIWFGTLLFILAGVLLLSVSVSVKAEKEPVVTVRIGGIRVYSNQSQKPGKHQLPSPQNKPESKEPEKEKKDSFFKPLKEKLGFSGAVKKLASLVFSILGRLKPFQKHIHFRNVVLEILVASEDAAKTAVEYGTVCTAVYPVVSLFESLFPSSVRKINIRSDFNAERGEIRASGTGKTRIFWLLLAAYGIFCELRAFQKRNGLLKQKKKGSPI